MAITPRLGPDLHYSRLSRDSPNGFSQSPTMVAQRASDREFDPVPIGAFKSSTYSNLRPAVRAGPRLMLMAKAEHDIVRIADDDHVARRLLLAPGMGPVWVINLL